METFTIPISKHDNIKFYVGIQYLVIHNEAFNMSDYPVKPPFNEEKFFNALFNAFNLNDFSPKKMKYNVFEWHRDCLRFFSEKYTVEITYTDENLICNVCKANNGPPPKYLLHNQIYYF
jgi:hypothetical protein